MNTANQEETSASLSQPHRPTKITEVGKGGIPANQEETSASLTIPQQSQRWVKGKGWIRQPRRDLSQPHHPTTITEVGGGSADKEETSASLTIPQQSQRWVLRQISISLTKDCKSVNPVDRHLFSVQLDIIFFYYLYFWQLLYCILTVVSAFSLVLPCQQQNTLHTHTHIF